ncbi:MAG: RrF2 family transcriptional regulator [Phycisphaeraceae bacterium]
MFGLSRKSDYAIVALARLARGGWPPRRLSAREIAEADDLPLALLSGLLQQLQHAELVSARRGVGGGYCLAVPPDEIRLAEVIRAVEGSEPVRLAACCGPQEEDEPGGCRIEARCPITLAIQRLNRRLGGLLEQTTLQELLAAEPASTR